VTTTRGSRSPDQRQPPECQINLNDRERPKTAIRGRRIRGGKAFGRAGGIAVAFLREPWRLEGGGRRPAKGALQATKISGDRSYLSGFAHIHILNEGGISSRSSR